MNKQPGTSPGFRPPRQERSRVTVERIVRATQELLAERGPEGTTVEQIVARADSSVGSFYARFEDRDAAVRYVEERFWTDVESRWAAYLDPERWEGRSTLEIIARVVRDLVRAMIADRASLRAFLAPALAHPRANLIERISALDGLISRRFGALLRQTNPSIYESREARVIEDGFARVLGAIRDAVLFGEASPEADRRLALSLVHMYGSSLGLDDLPSTWTDLLARCAGHTIS